MLFASSRDVKSSKYFIRLTPKIRDLFHTKEVELTDSPPSNFFAELCGGSE
jgi:hypothetical protein